MHLWKGKIIDQENLNRLVDNLDYELSESFNHPISLDLVLKTIDKFNTLITDQEMLNLLSDTELSVTDKKEEIVFLRKFIQSNTLKNKIKRELGTYDCFDLKRNFEQENVFEGKRPLGFLVHITPANSHVLAFLAALEGLLSLNLNLIKISSRDSDFSLKALKKLGEMDNSGIIKNYLLVIKIESKEKKLLNKILSNASGVSVWGGEAAVSEIKKMTPAQCKVISWGHKISFAYITQNYFNDEKTLQNLASDCIRLEQQACASPQCVYLDTESFSEIKQFASKLFIHLKNLSDISKPSDLPMEVQAEITNTTEMVRLDEVMIDSTVLEDDLKRFRIYVENDSSLKASPLYRSVWIKPLPRKNIVKELIGFRNFLQTAGLAGDTCNAHEVMNALLAAGVTRITTIGKMLETYEGESHDGVYPLSSFVKEVRVEINGAGSLSRLDYHKIKKAPCEKKVMTKSDFQKQIHREDKAKLYFKSGGSSGTTALSSFSYHDYHMLMTAASEGLIASGLDPQNDRVMNLFFGGGLYGGMISFFTILEKMQAIQFSMGAWQDLDFVGEMIVTNRVDTLLGMTSYLMQLFEQNKERFKTYNNIKKIFYGGEHFTIKQQKWVMDEFNVQLIKSGSYGSVDAGPLGYQCEHCEGSVHHLHDNIHFLEILKMDEDTPVTKNEIGRLIFSTPQRETLEVSRYEIGDTGRWVDKSCSCGRTSSLFELTGRMGDVFKAAGTFINYQKIASILTEKGEYQGEFQIEIKKPDKLDVLILKLDKAKASKENWKSLLLKNYKDLYEVVELEKSLILELMEIDSSAFDRVSSSGKLIRVKDTRIIR